MGLARRVEASTNRAEARQRLLRQFRMTVKTLRTVLRIVFDRHHRVVTASGEIEGNVLIDDLFVIGFHTDSSPCSAEPNG